jgi:hypothetical protein
VAGVSHTGSTLLGHILGELEDTCYAGEIRNTWERGILENRICTCKARFADCPFWQAVVERLPFPAHHQAHMLRGVRRKRIRASLDFPFRDRELRQPRTAEFSAATEALYAALAAEARVSQLVDSSKSPTYAALLSCLPTIDLRVVHLVRDPRATIYSHLRRDRFGYWGTFQRSLYWLRWNLAVERLARTGIPYTRLRYEDLVEDPAASLARIANALDLSASRLPIEGSVVRLNAKHIFAGNRARGQVGSITLRNDLVWKSKLPRRLQTIARATTFPLIGRYGYRSD